MTKKSWPGKGLGKQLSGQKEQLVTVLGDRAWPVGRLSAWSPSAGWSGLQAVKGNLGQVSENHTLAHHKKFILYFNYFKITYFILIFYFQ